MFERRLTFYGAPKMGTPNHERDPRIEIRGPRWAELFPTLAGRCTH